MHTTHFWRCTCAINGRRYTTRWRMTDDEARERLIDPERIDCGALAVEPAMTTPGGHWRSGLVRREDGVMMPP